MNNEISKKDRILTSCDDHISGLLGEALLRFFLKENLIKQKDGVYDITKKGWEELELIGIDIEKLKSNKRKMLNVCIESNHGIFYEHIGSSLGSLLMERMIELKWILKIDEKKYELTDRGITGLLSMGVKIKTLKEN